MRKGINILFGLMVLLASCEEKDSGFTEGQPIYLSATVPGMILTKTPFEGEAPTTINPLNVDVWASTEEHVYLDKGLDGRNNVDNIVSIHTTGHFQSGAPQLLSQAVYPPPRQGAQGSFTAASVYFVAMHPQSVHNGKGWSTTDGRQATYMFSGCEDVMYAPQVSGAYDTNEQNQVVSNSPKLEFEHLLTRITVKIGIELEKNEQGVVVERLEDVKEAWGKITDLQIQSYNKAGYEECLNTVTIDLSKGTGFSYKNDIKFSGEQSNSMGFFALGTNDTFPKKNATAPEDNGYQLTDQIDSVAYVMCAPTIATTESHEYVISVMTENRGLQKLELDLEKTATLKDELPGSTRGNHFSVTLKFRKGRAIATVANVTEWENGGFGSGEIED